jgi:hypothetical protein
MQSETVLRLDLFDHDDAGYLGWLAANPGGFVINCGRPASASYIMLHRASCGTITGRPANGGVWTDDYQKVCAPKRADLVAWAVLSTGAAPSPCGICHP